MSTVRRAGSILVVAVVLAACGGPAPSGSPSAVASALPSGPTASATPTAVVSASASGGAATASAPASPTPTPEPTPSPVPPPTPTPSPPPPIAEFPQTWSGNWEDPGTAGSGSLELVLTGKGGDFGGAITMDGTACLGSGVLEGSYDGRDIAFTVSQRGTILEFAGTADDATISGTFTSECDGLDGTWTVERSAR